MSFSLSSISLKSLYNLALGNLLTDLEALPEKSTSHKAATLSLPFTDAFAISLIPFPPEPIAAKFS